MCGSAFTYGIATVTYVVVMSPSPALVASGKTCGRPTPAPGLPRGRTVRYDVRAPGPERGRIMTGPDVTRTAANVPAVRRPGPRLAGRGQREPTGARPGDRPVRAGERWRADDGDLGFEPFTLAFD